MKQIRRLLTLFLCVGMVLSVLPFLVFADEWDSEEQDTQIEAARARGTRGVSVQKANTIADVTRMLNKLGLYFSTEFSDSGSRCWNAGLLKDQMKAIVDDGYLENPEKYDLRTLGMTDKICYSGYCHSNHYEGKQCMGFATWLEYVLFQSNHFDEKDKWCRYNRGNIPDDFQLQPGDYIRVGIDSATGHSAMIVSVSGDRFVCAEVSGDACEIHWRDMFHGITAKKLNDGSWPETTDQLLACVKTNGYIWRYKQLDKTQSYVAQCSDNMPTYATVRMKGNDCAWTLPCNSWTGDVSSREAENYAEGDMVTILRYVRNTATPAEYWCQIAETGSWIWAGNLEFVAFEDPFSFRSPVALSNLNITEDNRWSTVSGIISLCIDSGREWDIRSFWENETETQMMSEDSVAVTSYDLCGKINEDSVFGAVPPGNYVFYVVASMRMQFPQTDSDNQVTWKSETVVCRSNEVAFTSELDDTAEGFLRGPL